MKRASLYLLALTTLVSSAARAQTVSYVLVPTITPGVTVTKVELARKDLSLSQVNATFIADGKSGLGASPKTLKAYIGPSTSRTSPLVDLSPILNGAGGMVVLAPTPGLDAIEASFEIEQAPIRTAWKLPLLSINDFFNAGATVYVQNLVKDADASNNLQIFNPGLKPATCQVTVLRPRGTALEVRSGILVPAIGVVNLPDVLRKVGTGTAAGINAAVTCDQRFYAMGALPAADRWESRVQYPTAQVPAAKTAVTLASQPGEFFRVTRNNPVLNLPLPLAPNIAYHSLAIEFDLTTADPPDFVVFRNVIGMFRTGGRRFGKTLYFGSFENFDKGKYVIDFGSPFIETTVKRPIDLTGRRNLHFSITLDNDQRSLHYVITNASRTILLMDVLGGLYNPVGVVDGSAPTVQFGLPGVADNAYFPPYGWHFSNLSIVATK
jgi:hypothetical protein